MSFRYISIFSFFLCLIFAARVAYCDLDAYLAENNIHVREGYVIEAQKEFFRRLLSHQSIHLIGEIGFNAGHSSEIYLSTRSDTQVVSFDIGTWDYVQAGKAYLQNTYPGRLELVLGDSRQSVPAFYAQHPAVRFDLIFIDGGHSTEVAFLDIVNMRKLAHRDTVLIVDDLNLESVKLAWNKAIADHLIKPIYIYEPDERSWGVAAYL